MAQQRIPAWAIATALLLLKGEEEHIATLDREVRDTGWSNLGLTGKDPEKTLGSDFRQLRMRFVSTDMLGNYRITDEIFAAGQAPVRAALSRMVSSVSDQCCRFTVALLETDPKLTKINQSNIVKLAHWMARLKRFQHLPSLTVPPSQ